MSIRTRDKRIIAVEIGGTKLQAVLGNGDGDILMRRRGAVRLKEGAADILNWMESKVSEILRDADKEGLEVSAIGIGFGGPVASATGQALVSHQVAGWEGVPLKQCFEERFRLPVLVANDANAAGWAEYCRGVGRGTKQFCYMNIGSGIGGALVIDGRLYDGQGRGACEIGHTWAPDWTAPNPGATDKLENLCSGWAIERRLRAIKRLEPGTALYTACGGDPQVLSCPMLAEAARQGDARALEELGQVARAVGIALGNLVTLFHPERIALGGGVALMGEVLVALLREQLDRHIFPPYRGSTALLPCALEEDVVLVGALLLAADIDRQA